MPSEPDFRNYHKALVARLVRKFGSQHLESILDATQESYVAAIQSWPHKGTPDNPCSWLLVVAERALYRNLQLGNRTTELREEEIAPEAQQDELGLYFMTCSKRLSEREQICLMLRAVAGLSAGEIARLLHESEEAVQRRITRAKDKLKPEDLSPEWTEEKLQAVLLALYLLFTEGYETTKGEQNVRPEMALSALNLATELDALLEGKVSDLHALLCMMHFHISRFMARVDANGEAVMLLDQSRELFSQEHLHLGFLRLARAQSGSHLSRYHIEAGLAGAIAANANCTEILYWHELLIQHYPTPMGRISWAIALGMDKGPELGIAALEELKEQPLYRNIPHLFAAIGFFHAELNEKVEAASAYRKAIALEMSQPVRRSLERRVAELAQE